MGKEKADKHEVAVLVLAKKSVLDMFHRIAVYGLHLSIRRIRPRHHGSHEPPLNGSESRGQLHCRRQRHRRYGPLLVASEDAVGPGHFRDD